MILHIKIIQICVLWLALVLHPIHVSITNMEFFPEKNEIEFSTKVFKDDFHLLFIHLNELNIDFENIDSVNKYQGEINEYMNTHIQIEINNEQMIAYSSKFKLNDEAIWLSYRLKIKDEIKTIKIINNLLLDLYYDQKNLLILKLKDQEYAYQFNLKNTEFIINADK